MVGPLAQTMADWKAASKVVGLVCLLVDWSAGQMDKRTAVMTVVVWVAVRSPVYHPLHACETIVEVLIGTTTMSRVDIRSPGNASVVVGLIDLIVQCNHVAVFVENHGRVQRRWMRRCGW